MGNFDLVMCITSHFEGLKAICQECSQTISLSGSCCRLFWSVCLFIFQVEHCISQQFQGGSCRNIGGHAIYIEKEEKGPRTVTCGNPELTCTHSFRSLMFPL